MPRFPGPIRGIAMLENDFQLFNCQHCRRQVRICRFTSSANKVSCYTHSLGTDPSQIRHKIAGPLAALAHLTAMDGENAGGLQEQSLPCASRHLHIHVQWPDSRKVLNTWRARQDSNL